MKKDLEPYNCLEKGCQEYLSLFSTENQWVNHVKACHSIGMWVCRLRPHTSNILLDSEDDFRDHLIRDHDGMFPKSRIGAMIKAAYRPSGEILYETCPMNCGFQKTSESDKSSLAGHIATHLLCLALESLPERSVRSSYLGSSGKSDIDEMSSAGNSEPPTDDPYIAEEQIIALRESRDNEEQDQLSAATLWFVDQKEERSDVIETGGTNVPTDHELPITGNKEFDFTETLPFELIGPSTCNDYGDKMLRAQLENDEYEALSSIPDTDRPLEDQLREALQTHAGPGASAMFLPVKQLQRLMTIDNVLKELSECPKLNRDNIEQYAQEICGISSAEQKDSMDNIHKGTVKKIFAILVLMGRVKTIPEFLETELTDADLPFGKYGESKGKFDLRRKTEDYPLKCFKSWKQDHIDRFYNWQWSMISPFFSRGPEEKVQFYNFEDGTILPWVFDSRTSNDNQDPVEVPGGYSVVWKVKIHPEHHDFHRICVSDHDLSAHQS